MTHIPKTNSESNLHAQLMSMMDFNIHQFNRHFQSKHGSSEHISVHLNDIYLNQHKGFSLLAAVHCFQEKDSICSLELLP